MKQTIQKYLEYLRAVRNASPHTLVNYRNDLEQFLAFLTPPETETPPLGQVTHHLIREFVAHLHDSHMEKSSIARKLAALRSFFKYCVREGRLKENPARLVPTPKLPKRLPSVLSAEEMNAFLNHLATIQRSDAVSRQEATSVDSTADVLRDDEQLFLRRDRAMLELLYAAGLRVSELTGLNLVDIDQREHVLRVRGKGNKERIVPYGSKAQESLENYWPVREQLLESASQRPGRPPHNEAVFLNYAGRRLTQRSVGRT